MQKTDALRHMRKAHSEIVAEMERIHQEVHNVIVFTHIGYCFQRNIGLIRIEWVACPVTKAVF